MTLAEHLSATQASVWIAGLIFCLLLLAAAVRYERYNNREIARHAENRRLYESEKFLLPEDWDWLRKHGWDLTSAQLPEVQIETGGGLGDH